MRKGYYKFIQHTSFSNKSVLSEYLARGIGRIATVLMLFFPTVPLWGQSQTFTANGTFTVPPGVTSIAVECWGAGGAGGGTTSNFQDGGGGGAGGAYAIKTLTVIPGTMYTVTVGGITTGTTSAGSNGAPSWFGTTGTVYAEGGAGGAAPNGGIAAGGTGSAASSIGDVVYPGGDGANGNSTLSGGGGGGAGSTGSGGNASGTTAGSGAILNGGDGGTGRTNEGNGNSGSNYGGGGSGAYVPDFTNHSGGDGAAGLVIVTWSAPTYTSSGTFTVPAGITSIIVECWGAGGAGGGTTSNSQNGGGGGAGGAYAKKTLTVVPGTNYTVTVGGVTTGTTSAGSNGAPSWFGTTGTVYAEGGAGGAAPNGGIAAGGTGSATSSIGDVVYPGGNGADGNTTLSGGGGGGAGSTGSGGNASGTTAGSGTSLNGGNGGTGRTNEGNGNPGSNYGGGGSGAYVPDFTNHTGGDGAPGLVLITCCVPTTMGYNFERNISIDHTKVTGGSDLYNFPVLVNISSQDFLKNEPAGDITNANGFDIIFADKDYNQLDHQLEYYNGTTGDLIAWVRIPTLSSSYNTEIKILYGNPQIVADPSVTTVWDSHYKGVWHLNDNNLDDATSFDKAGTPYNTPAYSTGVINNSLELNGTDDYVVVLNDPNINFAGNITVSAWVWMDTGGRDQKIAGNQNNSSGGYKFGIYTNNKVEFEIRNSANVPSLNRGVSGGTVLSAGQWYYLAGISSDVLDSIKTFVNGIPERPFKKTGILGIASDNLTIGKEPFLSNYYFDGRFDELRISNIVRSDGWMRTEYFNQSSPSTFYNLDAIGTASDTLLSQSICSVPITLTFGYPSGGVYSGNPYISGNLFTPPAAGVYSITYTYTGPCGPDAVTKEIIITDAPSPPVAPDKEYCQDMITYLEATTGENIRWYEGGLLVSTANPFSTGETAPGIYNYTVTQTVNGCESAPTAVTLTIFAGITINDQPQPVTICETDNTFFSVDASGYSLTYQWQEDGIDITDGGIYSGTTTSTLTLTNPGISKDGKQYRCVISSPCGTSPQTSNSATLTVTPLPVATFNYPDTPYCPNAADPFPTFTGGGVAGIFSSTPGLVFISTSTGQVDLSASTPGNYVVTNTIAAAGGCGIVFDTSPISIISGLTWTGTVSTDWNDSGNWSCGYIPGLTTPVLIPDVPNKPVLSTGSAGSVFDITIDNGSSLTVSGNTLKISGVITNNGTFTADAGTIEMDGSVAQVIDADIFAGNTIEDLIINNPSGVTLLGTLKITGIVTSQNGDLATGGYLTLLSTAAQTALIDGSGTGTISGNVIMQRYLSSGFGYKYFSSPFQAATVNEFSDEVNLADPFPPIFKYDESRTSSGWVSYVTPANTLNPLEGYAVNFGSSATPVTVDITGTVNNGNQSRTIYNNNNTYTLGFNLAGNPYPSPIDWDAASGWTKTSIDDALYYFKASATDQYGGTYSTYINGVSSDGLATNIIPSMQGFFVHVTDGSYPVTGTLGMTNSVRVTDLTHIFLKSAAFSSSQLLRMKVCFMNDTLEADPMVVYFNGNATGDFDSKFDALKLYNTDLNFPNLYSFSTDQSKLSINALPFLTEEYISIPLGLKLNKAGDIIFRLSNIDDQIATEGVYLIDVVAGTSVDMISDKEYSVSLSTGEYTDRFYLNIGAVQTSYQEINEKDDLINIYSSYGILKVNISRLPGGKGLMQVFDLLGRKLYSKQIYEEGYHEYTPGLANGIYIIRFECGKEIITKKIVIRNQ
jgi:hypothetical protein